MKRNANPFFVLTALVRLQPVYGLSKNANNRWTDQEGDSFLRTLQEWNALLQDTVNWEISYALDHKLDYEFQLVPEEVDLAFTIDGYKAVNPKNSRKYWSRLIVAAISEKGLLLDSPSTSLANTPIWDADGPARFFLMAIGTRPGANMGMNIPPLDGKTNVAFQMGRIYNDAQLTLDACTHEFGHMAHNIHDMYGGVKGADVPFDGGTVGSWERMASGGTVLLLGFTRLDKVDTDFFVLLLEIDNDPNIGSHILRPVAVQPTEAMADSLDVRSDLNTITSSLVMIPCDPGWSSKDPGPFNGFTLELRLRLGADESLPDEGVILSKVMQGLPGANDIWVVPNLIPPPPRTTLGQNNVPNWHGGHSEATFRWSDIQMHAAPLFSTPSGDLQIEVFPYADDFVRIVVNRQQKSESEKEGCENFLRSRMNTEQQIFLDNNN
jgi:hypothetical protein